LVVDCIALYEKAGRWNPLSFLYEAQDESGDFVKVETTKRNTVQLLVRDFS
jgi:hypothetical protein